MPYLVDMGTVTSVCMSIMNRTESAIRGSGR